MPRTIETIVPAKKDADFQQLVEGKIAQRLAPFVLFDAVRVIGEKPWGFDWHAHSGVATLTYIYGATLDHAGSGGCAGKVYAGGFQWMQAGGGIWHREMLDPVDGFIGAHQLWIQLPPEFEEGENCYFDVVANAIPQHEHTKVLVGKYGEADAGIDIPADVSYFDVTLPAGEQWHFEPPASQQRGFVFPRKGKLSIGEEQVGENDLGIFADGQEEIVIKAEDDAQFVLALTALPTFPLVRAYGQVHTSREALARSTERIKAIKPTISKRL